MQRACQAVKGGRDRVIDVGEGGAHQQPGVGADIAALVVGMEEEVEPGEVLVILVLHAHHVRHIGRPVELVVGGDHLPVLVGAPVDEGRDHGQAGEEGQRVLEHRVPVLVPLETLAVALREDGIFLHRQHADGQLRHGVHVLREGFERVQHVAGEFRALPDFRLEFLHGGVGGHLAGEEEMPQRERGGHGAGRGLGQLLPDLGDGEPAEADAFHRVEVGGVAGEGLDVPHPPHHLVHGHFVHFHVGVLFHEFLEVGPPRGDQLRQRFLKFDIRFHCLCSP